MLRSRTVLSLALVAAGLLALSSCMWTDDDAAEVDEEPALAVAAEEDADVIEGPQPKLEPRIKPGDRFPLLKTVEQTLRQPTEQGWAVSRSNLEILLSVTVREIRPQFAPRSRLEDARAGEKRLEVEYHRVQFSQQLPGRPRVEYNSEAPVSPIPVAALGYHALRGNGFEFWLSRDHQVVEIVAFEQFLDRCLHNVPAERQPQVRSLLAASSGVEGLANFVDDSLGLWPASAVREGDTWTRDRQILQPVPMHSSTQYVLRRLTEDVAEIDIIGTLSAVITNQEGQARPDVEVSIRGGQAQGTCLLDRRSGLPLNSRVEQTLDMLVKLPDGKEFEQHKTTTSTIRAVPDQPEADPVRGSSPSATGSVIQAAAEVDAAPATASAPANVAPSGPAPGTRAPRPRLERRRDRR